MLNLSTANANAIASDTPFPVDFVEMIIDPSSTPTKIIRLTNHYHNLTVGGNVYTSTGELLGFSEITDNLEAKDNSLELQLSGVSSTFTAVMLAESIEGSLVSISRGYYNEAAGTLVDAPFLRWSGRVNNFSIQDDHNSYNSFMQVFTSNYVV